MMGFCRKRGRMEGAYGVRSNPSLNFQLSHPGAPKSEVPALPATSQVTVLLCTLVSSSAKRRSNYHMGYRGIK